MSLLQRKSQCLPLTEAAGAIDENVNISLEHQVQTENRKPLAFGEGSFGSLPNLN